MQIMARAGHTTSPKIPKNIESFRAALDFAEPRPEESDDRAAKKNYAQRLSDACAVMFAHHLREHFPGILPGPDGEKRESHAPTNKGFKKLDVNYSTAELGLALGLSIKTINFKDGMSGRYTKNVTRVDNELRAEAMDYHVRQPWSVMICILYMPLDACQDGSARTPSSFGQTVKTLRHRALRIKPSDDGERFEEIFIGLYEYQGKTRGNVRYFDIKTPPPKTGLPKASSLLTFEAMRDAIMSAYKSRNDPPFEWESD